MFNISQEVQEEILRITVLVAVARPAEFIEITFMQQMQKSWDRENRVILGDVQYKRAPTLIEGTNTLEFKE